MQSGIRSGVAGVLAAALAAAGGAAAGEREERAEIVRLFFGSAATLDAGRSAVELLQYRTLAPTSRREEARRQLEARYRSYTEAVAAFQSSSARLLDDAGSDRRLFQALMSGLAACWQLDLDVRLLESYGVGPQAQTPILSSLEACARFRDAAFGDTVQAILAASLTAAERDERENERLRVELAELQRLVEELRAIE